MVIPVPAARSSAPPHVVMLLSRSYAPDVRAQKEAHTLAAAGCRVTILAWDRTQAYPPHFLEHMPPTLEPSLVTLLARASRRPQPVAVTHCRTRAGYRTGRALLRRMPQFWRFAWDELRRCQPDVMHAHDLDTLPVALAYARWRGIPLVYDMREYYAGMVRANVGAILGGALVVLDAALLPQADAVVTVGERLATYARRHTPRVTVVHNSHPLIPAAAQAHHRADWRARLRLPDDELVIVYAGYLAPDRLLAPLLTAAPLVAGVHFVIAGDGPLMGQVRAVAARSTRLHALGWIPLAEIPGLVSMADVVYYGLQASNANSFYFMPNLAFFALAAGRPLLTTPVGEIAEWVERDGWGMVLSGQTASELAHSAQRALTMLTNATRRAEMAQRAARLGQQRGNWAYDAQRLVQLYQTLVPLV